MKRLVHLIALGLMTTSAVAQPPQVVGYLGHLGEWELVAAVTESGSGRAGEFSGPLTMKHIGLCSRDGPEEKSGHIRFQMPAAASWLNAKLVIAGEECSYSGRLSGSYNGMMDCPGRQAIPLQIWLK